jgi:hypothetical protein
MKVPVEEQTKREGWQARRDSNPQHPDLESGALPFELLACGAFFTQDRGERQG